MAKVKFIHTADLHLDTPFKGLTNWNAELAQNLKNATFKSFRNIIDLSLHAQVDFLLISGDIFDSKQESLAAKLFLIQELERLSRDDIKVYVVCGNHDPYGGWVQDVNKLENVSVFGPDEVEKHTYKKDGEDIADIYGISFDKANIKENLASQFMITEPAAPISIALLHGTIGSSGPHRNYAPFKLEEIKNTGFDYWALGHIHKKDVVHKGIPTIVYPGNPQGRDFGETGDKSCCLVEIDAGLVPSVEYKSVNQLRFEELTISLSIDDNIHKVTEKIFDAQQDIPNYNEQKNYVLRVNLTGRTSLHERLIKHEEILEIVDNINEGQFSRPAFTWVDRIEVNTQPDIDLANMKKGEDFAASILRQMDKYSQDKDKQKKLFESAGKDMAKPEAKREIDDLTATEKEQLLQNAKWQLINQIVKGS
jgi:DNA repair exonuclease SbcCD nuclease subunit